MASQVIYLDVDDEITSAAARIRGTEASRVALVLPYGSRVATSRINFRLLARDAQTNGKRLSVVAHDAATRALAASAGLPIFGSVTEYESSLEGAGVADPEPGPATARAAALMAAAERDDAGPIEGALVSETVATPRHDRGPSEPAAASEASKPAPATAATAAAATAAVTAAGATTASVGPAGSTAAVRHPTRAPAGIPAARVVADNPDRPPADLDRPAPTGRARPTAPAWRPAIGRTPVAVGAAVLGLALVVTAVGAFLLLPTATATITPRTETIGPISMRIRADPTATEPDLANAVVPAERITIPLEASDTFPATGKRIEEARASGRVTFQSYNPVSSNTIEKGSIISTEGGIRFRTVREITIPAAELIFGTPVEVKPSSESVDVTAIEAGTEGNVPVNAITVVPRNEDPDLTKVRNREATAGGKHDEFPRIRQEDVDAAVAALTKELSAAFEDQLLDPALPGDTGTVFPATKSLGDPVFAEDPAKLVGQEKETFELAASSEGSVVAVDTAPVQEVAEAKIVSSVEPGFELIEGSGLVEDAPAEISGGEITFPVVVTAEQVLVLDPGVIEAEIMGKTLPEARAILATYGEADLSVWPDWVGTIPTLDSRVEIATTGPIGSEAPEPSPVASP